MVYKRGKKKKFAASGNVPQCDTDFTTDEIPQPKLGSKKFKKVQPPLKHKVFFKATYCEVCSIQCTSENQLKEHLRGARHKQALEKEENVTDASEHSGGAKSKDCSSQKKLKAIFDKYAIYRRGQNADKSTESVQNAGETTNPVQNAGKSTNSVQNAGKSTNPVINAGKRTISVQNARKSTNPVHNAGKSTNPVQNAGKSTNSVKNAGKRTISVQNAGKSTISEENTDTITKSDNEINQNKEKKRIFKQLQTLTCVLYTQHKMLQKVLNQEFSASPCLNSLSAREVSHNVLDTSLALKCEKTTFPGEKQDEMEGTLINSHSTLYTDDCLEEEDDEEDEHFELRNNADLEQYLKTFKILTEEDASFVLNVIQTITQALLRYKDDCMAKKATEETAESGDSSTSTVVSNPSRKRPFSPSSETDFAKKAKSECCNSSQTPLQDQQASNPSFTEDSSHRLQSDAGLTSPGSPASSETPSYVHTIITQLFGNRYNLGLTEVILELTNNDALKDPSIDAEAIIRTLVQTGRLNILLT